MRAMYEATGDRRFADALAAIEAHGFEQRDAGSLRRTKSKIIGNHETVTYFPRMHTLVGRGATVRHAAAQVAYTWSIPGTTFGRVIKSLEDGYRKWFAGHEIEVAAAEAERPKLVKPAAGKRRRGELP